MSRIYVDFGGVKQISNNCRAISTAVEEIKSDFENTVRQLDWDIRFEADINNTANQLARKLDGYRSALNSYQSFVDNAYEQYADLNEYESGDLDNGLKFIGVSVNPNMFITTGPSLLWMFKPIEELFKDIQGEEDLLSGIKDYLTGADKFGGNDEAGLMGDLIDYFQNLAGFFLGDKKGWTGAGGLCDLATGSVKLWTGMYDYFQNMYDGLTTGFFGETAQRNVKILGLSSGFVGLIGSLLTATDSIGKKEWQSVVADYLEGGKDVVSIIGSAYELKHIKDVTSMAGPWNPAKIYSAIGEAGVNVLQQGFKSHERYYADGKWDLGDTGATGIDISIAGLYGLTHSLTFGLDDKIFGWVDEISGGDKHPEMSYVEKAAEGYKILGEKIGDSIASWWNNLTK